MPDCRTAAPTPAKGPLPWRAAPPALCLGLQAGPGRARPATRGPRDGSRRASLLALTRPRSLPHLNNQTARARQQGRLLPHHVLQGRPHFRRHQRRVSALRWRLLPRRGTRPHHAAHSAYLPAGAAAGCRAHRTLPPHLLKPHSPSALPPTAAATSVRRLRAGGWQRWGLAACARRRQCRAAPRCRLDGTTGAAPALSGCSQTDSYPLAA